MAKRHKYTLELVIFDKTSIERIKEAKEFYQVVDDKDDIIIVKKTGMTGIECIKVIVFMASAIQSICVSTDSKGVPDNWGFTQSVNEAIFNFIEVLDHKFTGKQFDAWYKDFIAKEKEESDPDTWNETHIRANLNDVYGRNCAFLVGYDWED